MNRNHAMIAFEQVSFRYSQVDVLRQLSFEVLPGEFVGILGPNGSGKSTLLKLCNRILKPMAGRIWLEGCDIARLSQRQIAQRVAMVAQENYVPFNYTTAEVVLTGRHPFVSPLGFETKQDRMIVERAMELLKIVDLSQRPFATLSGGEKQRALVATALAQTPKLLLLDEPTSSMDLKHQMDIYEILKKNQQAEGLTILAVTHDVNLAAMFCDRLIFLKRGAVVDYGKPDELVTRAKMDSLYDVAVSVLSHPIHGTPLVFPN
ncbi:MAG: ABC transporter ATP-binding protein [candidate division KSB1 bacterium]|nr:ABC transporter ATP-binding protein [candidate division KSB1 bacterium]MDZ7341703.1 ABC transporter ATP-binding protein [candidate division KSB1 bacterium]